MQTYIYVIYYSYTNEIALPGGWSDRSGGHMKDEYLLRLKPEEVEIVEAAQTRYGLNIRDAIGYIIRDWQEQKKLQAAMNRGYGIKTED
jgi:hypothetical protein